MRIIKITTDTQQNALLQYLFIMNALFIEENITLDLNAGSNRFKGLNDIRLQHLLFKRKT